MKVSEKVKTTTRPTTVVACFLSLQGPKFQKMNVNFNPRSRKINPTNVNAVIRYNRQRLVYPTGIKVDPKNWNKDTHRLTRVKGFSEINLQLTDLETAIQHTYRKLLNDNGQKEPTTDELKTALDLRLNRVKNDELLSERSFLSWSPPDNDSPTAYRGFMGLFLDESLSRKNDRTGHPFSKNTIRNYRSTIRAVAEFTETKMKSRNLLFENVDQDFYKKFITYLEKVRRLSPNSIGTYIKVIKTVLREAEERGLTVNPAYKGRKFKTLSIETDAIYLTESELDDIAKLDLSGDKRLERVRDLFLVGCHTGLRWSDFSDLKSEDFETGRIRKKTKKQKEYVFIPIHPEVKRIREIYDTENQLPPPISNQKFNDYLKEICQRVPSLQMKVTITKIVAGKEQPNKVKKCNLVSSHTARRSFATNCYLKGVPVRVIMRITGHKKEDTFFKYIRMTPTDDSKILEMYLSENVTTLKVV